MWIYRRMFTTLLVVQKISTWSSSCPKTYMYMCYCSSFDLKICILVFFYFGVSREKIWCFFHLCTKKKTQRKTNNKKWNAVNQNRRSKFEIFFVMCISCLRHIETCTHQMQIDEQRANYRFTFMLVCLKIPLKKNEKELYLYMYTKCNDAETK